ncbi:MAG: plasmid pRiA4b ORF-3 family protein [Lachnospiraceae bacterium]|nr:plasmid pRiA4b ORF-3 family protein [Lachnospiraceae bacterium]
MKLYTLKVYPKGKGREVYRIIHILGKESLDRLCRVILDSYNFIDEHLYEFCLDNRMYDEDNYQSDPEYDGQPSTREKIDSLKLIKGQKFILHYDFGDDWMFVIGVQKIEETEENLMPYISNEKGFLEQYPSWDEEDIE